MITTDDVVADRAVGAAIEKDAAASPEVVRIVADQVLGNHHPVYIIAADAAATPPRQAIGNSAVGNG